MEPANNQQFKPDIDGDLTLQGLEQRCEVEQAANFQLSDIKHGTKTSGATVIIVNHAVFDRKRRNRLKDLNFALVANGQTPAQVRAEIEADGWTFICDAQVAVENHIKTVVIGGKKDFPA